MNYLGNFNSPSFGQFPASTITISDSTLDRNVAKGGDSGDGLGSGLANVSNAVATVTDSTISHNRAVGGPGGGNAFGGGFYNDATSTLTLVNDTVTHNHAHAGSGGEGIGGGIYNLGVLNSLATTVKHNHATTSNDNIFG